MNNLGRSVKDSTRQTDWKSPWVALCLCPNRPPEHMKIGYAPAAGPKAKINGRGLPLANQRPPFGRRPAVRKLHPAVGFHEANTGILQLSSYGRIQCRPFLWSCGRCSNAIILVRGEINHIILGTACRPEGRRRRRGCTVENATIASFTNTSYYYNQPDSV